MCRCIWWLTLSVCLSVCVCVQSWRLTRSGTRDRRWTLPAENWRVTTRATSPGNYQPCMLLQTRPCLDTSPLSSERNLLLTWIAIKKKNSRRERETLDMKKWDVYQGSVQKLGHWRQSQILGAIDWTFHFSMTHNQHVIVFKSIPTLPSCLHDKHRNGIKNIYTVLLVCCMHYTKTLRNTN